MSNLLWWLGGYYLLTKLDRQERLARENARRLAELEKAVHDDMNDEQALSAVGGENEPGGCLAVLGCLASLTFLVGLAVFLVWLFFW